MKMLDLDTETAFHKKYMDNCFGFQKWSFFFFSFFLCTFLSPHRKTIKSLCVYYNRGKALLEPPAIVVNLTFPDSLSPRKENKISNPNFLILFRWYFKIEWSFQRAENVMIYSRFICAWRWSRDDDDDGYLFSVATREDSIVFACSSDHETPYQKRFQSIVMTK